MYGNNFPFTSALPPQPPEPQTGRGRRSRKRKQEAILRAQEHGNSRENPPLPNRALTPGELTLSMAHSLPVGARQFTSRVIVPPNDYGAREGNPIDLAKRPHERTDLQHPLVLKPDPATGITHTIENLLITGKHSEAPRHTQLFVLHLTARVEGEPQATTEAVRDYLRAQARSTLSTDGDPALTPGGSLDHEGYDFFVLFMGQSWAFAGCADGDQPVAALIDMPIHELFERVKIHCTVLKRCDQCRHRPFEHCHAPFRVWRLRRFARPANVS